MNNLSEQVVSCVKASSVGEVSAIGMGAGLSDYGQRSAIGIARSSLELSYKPKEPNSLDRKPARDALASELITLMEGHSKDDCLEALLEARKVVNAPFQVVAHSGASLQKPGAGKKAREESKA